MIIQTNLYIAFKCDECDNVQICEMSMFKFFKGSFEIRCKCEESGISVMNISKEKLRIATYCPKCDNVHVFLLKRDDLIREKVKVLYCPYSDVETCIIGNDRNSVMEEIDFIETRIESLVDHKLNTKGYFTNTKITYESIEKINEIKKNGMLTCWCGNDDIALYMLKDKLVLRCKRCMTRKDIPTVSNKELNELKKKDRVFLDE